MALSFFHGDQLVRGAAAAEEIEAPTLLSRPASDERGGSGKSQRLQSQTIRKLQSETALSAHARADAASVGRSYAREEKGKEPLRPGSRSRPATSYSYHSDSSDSLPVEVSRGRPMAILGVRKPSFLNVRSNSTRYSKVEPERPKSSGNEELSWRKKESSFKSRLHEEFSTGPRVSMQPETPARERPAVSNRTSAAHGNNRAVGESRVSYGNSGFGSGGGGGGGIGRSSQSVKHNPPRLFMPPKDTIDPGQFLAESLAHVIVGEWLYKDPNKPGLMPQANILQRHLGPPPRGSTGLPQKRWFRIDPYERLLTWSSKWDSAASAQHKARRRVPINLVFEVSNRIVSDGCIPPYAMPHNESIVVVAPLQVLKMTAPDETRHALWMTALQYLVDSKKVPAHAWPDVLASRLSPLSTGVRGGIAQSIRPAALGAPLRTPTAEAGLGCGNLCKPLPPTPSSSAAVPAVLASGGLYHQRAQIASTAIMTPPAVPRYSHHAHRDSDGELSIRRSEMSGTSPLPSVRSSSNKLSKSKTCKSSSNNNNTNTNQSEDADMYASSSVRHAPVSPKQAQQPSTQSLHSQESHQTQLRHELPQSSQQPRQPTPQQQPSTPPPQQQQQQQRQEPRQLLQPYEHQHREHRPQEHDVETITDNGSDDYEVDQMDELVAGLGNI